jgi:hypothetical protein
MSTNCYPKWDTTLVRDLIETGLLVKVSNTDSDDDDPLYELSTEGKKAGRTVMDSLYQCKFPFCCRLSASMCKNIVLTRSISLQLAIRLERNIKSSCVALKGKIRTDVSCVSMVDLRHNGEWRDDATTAKEEARRAGKIPEAIVGKNYAAPFLPPYFTIRESQVDNACVPTVRQMSFKLEPTLWMKRW